MNRTAAILVLLAAPLSAADPTDAVREAALGWTQAAVKQDRAALERLLADDITYAHANGRVQNKGEYVEAVTSGPPRYESFDFTEVKISIYGKAAVLTAFVDVKMVGSPSFRVRTLQVYVENGGRWQFAAHQSARLGR